MYDKYDVTVNIINQRKIGTAEPAPVPDPTPAGLYEFVPAGSTGVLITADGAIFYCKQEEE